MLQYPLELRFKLMTLGQRIWATDASGRTLMFIKQKMFKLREKVEIYSDESQSNLLFRIEAGLVVEQRFDVAAVVRGRTGGNPAPHQIEGDADACLGGRLAVDPDGAPGSRQSNRRRPAESEGILALDPEARVVLMSGYTRDATVRQLMAHGLTDFLPKPFRPQELIDKVRGVLEPAG